MANIDFLRFEDKDGRIFFYSDAGEEVYLSPEEWAVECAEAMTQPCPYCGVVFCECPGTGPGLRYEPTEG